MAKIARGGIVTEIVDALPSGDNTIGRVKLTDGTDVALINSSGHLLVDIATDSVGIGGGTQYTEDAAAAANPVGSAVILVRDDAPGTLVSDEGDNVAQRGTNYGAAYTQVVTSAGAFVDTFGGGEQHATNEAYTDTDSGTVALTVRDDALTTLTEADGDYSTLRVDSTGAQWVRLTNATLAVTQSGTWDEVGINDSGNSITVDNAQLSVVGSGTEAAALRVTIATDSTGVLSIDDNGAAITVDGTVTAELSATDNAVLDNIDADLTTIIGHVDGVEGLLTTIDGDTGGILTAVQLIDNIVKLEDDPHSTADAGVMLLAVRQSTQSDFGADGDYVPLSITDDGELRVTTAAGTGTSAADDADFVDGTTPGTPAMGVYEATPSTVTDGDLGIVGITEDRRLKVLADLSATDNAVLDTIDSVLDTINAKLVTGTVIGDVNLGATDNAVLDAIAASVAAIDTDATTIIGHVDGIETVLGTIDADTSGIITAVQLIDDVIYVDDADWSDGTSKHALVGGLYQSSPQTVTDGDVAPFNITENGALHVAQQGNITADLGATDNAVLDAIETATEATQAALETAGGLVVNLGANNDVTVTGTVDLGATDNAVLDAIAASLALLDNSIATGNELQVDVVAALPAGDNNIGNVDIVSGTITTVSTVSALGTGTTGPMKAEDVGHSTGDMGIPAWGVRTDVPNAVGAGTTGDYSFLATDMAGGLRTALYETDFAVLGTKHVKKYYTNAGAVTDGIIWSPAAGARWYVTDLIINVSAAATVTLEDDKAGGDEAVMKFELAANSGIAHHFQTPLFSGEDAADLIITTSAGNVYATVTGYEI